MTTLKDADTIINLRAEVERMKKVIDLMAECGFVVQIDERERLYIHRGNVDYYPAWKPGN